jgi:hypothetical protein
MTKPTGRPRGRPKTKEYVTLMARVDVTLAARVKRYAATHHQPISVVIRDALLLLMDEYPSSADLSAPHRIAAHEFLSDRYDSSLDMLLGETDSAELEALLSDTNAEIIDTFLEGANSRPDMVSDTQLADAPLLSDRKEIQPDIVSDKHMDAPNPRAIPSWRTQSAKASDTKGVPSSIPSDTKADVPSFLSDAKRGNRTPDVQEVLPGMMSARKAAKTESTPVAALRSDTNVPAFDTTKYSLGKLCPRGHDYHGTGQSLRRLPRHICLKCDAEKTAERRAGRRKAESQDQKPAYSGRSAAYSSCSITEGDGHLSI